MVTVLMSSNLLELNIPFGGDQVRVWVGQVNLTYVYYNESKKNFSLFAKSYFLTEKEIKKKIMMI